MHVSCPNCQAVFIADTKILKKATKLKCSKCEHMWDKKPCKANTCWLTKFICFLFKSFVFLLLLLVALYYSISALSDMKFEASLDKFIREDDKSIALFVKIDKKEPGPAFSFFNPNVIQVTFVQGKKTIATKFVTNNFSLRQGEHMIVKTSFQDVEDFEKIDLKLLNIADFALYQVNNYLNKVL
ncbi:hypothetical protein phytr_7580 [Candidatus Phycorickettsia trachydisci]|uniref:Zinc finger/thioredoxin putative domain-containing protein n=2 Tax=Candidatus Phycorickettsia trachydisci TaxID=2115978 RepID=A0A2P1P8V3_9RICK|nr:hypothetical protein phytr_7580 [Candidatus Phycorickettsia trachydisci]